jgi:hypothetical protein
VTDSVFKVLSGLPIDQLAERFRNAQPYPHLVLDDFLPEAEALALEQDCRQASTPLDSSNDFTQKTKTTLNDWRLMPERLQSACGFFNSGAFVDVLEAMTGLSGLIADPHLDGGGVHRTLRGGFLKLHTDFNWNPRLRLHRRLNALYFLNSGYQEDWGGELFLADQPGRQQLDAMSAVAPRFNRLVLFNSNDTTFHGHPRPHTFPEGYPRTSLAFYYYTATERPWRERRRLRASTTRYVPALQELIDTSPATLRGRLGYWIRRWTPFA